MKIDILTARAMLLEGKVVAIPTETVYGLAGWINSESGLRKIFSSKERPFFDPLIVHIDSIESARKLTSEWTEAHQALAESCWPGPLTLIAKKNMHVHPLITAGLDSVGLRCPRHPLTLELLSTLEGGLAAPSANKFGKTSPTSYSHVEDEFNGQIPIIDGGNCDVGIESTVVGIKKEDNHFLIEIYRPGYFTSQHLTSILEAKAIKVSVIYAESPVAPGQLKHHYMPSIPLVIVPAEFSWKENQGKIEELLHKKFTRPIIWKQSTDPRIASRELYEKMRSFVGEGFDIILCEKSTSHEEEDWLGIWNRLEKAKTLKL